MTAILPWYGGKHIHRRWINGLLGRNATYFAEPFFGMGSVLLDREPSRIEVVCDTNDRVVNWWKVLRSRPDEVAEAIAITPSSRSLFRAAVASLDEGSDLDRAVAFHTVVSQGFASTDAGSPAWSHRRSVPWLGDGYAAGLRRTARRIRRLRIDDRCASHLLEYMSEKSDAVVYVDPPYWGAAAVNGYRRSAEADIADLLLAQRGRCAVSGYGGQWDHLGWERHEKEVKMIVRSDVSADARVRTEVLWTNFRPETSQTELDLEEMG